VHKGTSPPEDLIQEISGYCGEIAFCLLRLQNDESKRDGDFLEKWLQEIDVVVALCQANQEIEDVRCATIGAWTEGLVRHRDFFSKLKTNNMPAA
jgi:hypothetical protein